MRRKNGFTLVELIVSIALILLLFTLIVPGVTKLIHQSKVKQCEQIKDTIESAVDLYVTEHKNSVYKKLDLESQEKCRIGIDSENYKKYITEDANIDADGNEITGFIIFNRNENTYEYKNVNDANGIVNCD